MTLTPPTGEWYMDSGATAHMASTSGILTHCHPPSSSTPSSIIVDNGTSLPVVSMGSTHMGPIHLNNVLVSPSIIKNLVSVRQFTIDNNCSVEFDPAGFSVKDLRTRSVIARCNSSGDLNPLSISLTSTTTPQVLLTSASSQLWHRRLGHISHDALRHLTSSSSISCNKGSTAPDICHTCQLGRHVRLPFSISQSRALRHFDLVHCDLWISGYKYYLAILDDCSHFLWTFPLLLKSDTFPTIANFFSFVATQFGTTIKSLQCNNGREFDNSHARAFFLSHGVHLRMSCPYTSQQNGRAECVLCTVNNIVRSLLFQAHLPAPYWVEALHTATYLLNLHPTSTLNYSTPHHALFGRPHLTTISVSLAVSAIPTYLPLPPINSLPAPPCVSSMVTRLNTKATAVLISPPIVSSSPATLCSTNPPFRSPRPLPARLFPLTLIFWIFF
jgi:hypothetical protein